MNSFCYLIPGPIKISPAVSKMFFSPYLVSLNQDPKKDHFNIS